MAEAEPHPLTERQKLELDLHIAAFEADRLWFDELETGSHEELRIIYKHEADAIKDAVDKQFARFLGSNALALSVVIGIGYKLIRRGKHV